MVIVESRLSSRTFGCQLETPLLQELGRALAALLGFFGVLRVFDLWQREALHLVVNGSYEAMLFQVELLLGVVVPMGLLLMPRVRLSPKGLYAASLFAILGFVVNRLNVSITGFEAQNGSYIPAWSEVLITLMLVALGFGLFGLGVRFLKVFPETKHVPARGPMRLAAHGGPS
jgi:Ni/Fe-hydrogenase subunit HybB-like protein